MQCPHCSQAIHEPCLEPLYSLREAERLIPLLYPTLVSYLRYHKDLHPAIYRDWVEIGPRNKRTHRRIRLLPASEIQLIRQKYLNGPGLDRLLGRVKDG